MAYLITVVLLMAMTPRANAYIDAGSGSYMLQIVLATFMAAVFAVKLSFQRLKDFAGRVFAGVHKNS